MKDAFMLKLFGGLRTTPAILCTIALIAALLGGGGRAAAQNKNLNLKITVLSNTDGQPVVGASCLLTDYGIFSITDPDGKADLNKVPRGTASLSVQMLGCSAGFREFVADVIRLDHVRLHIFTVDLV